MSLHRAQFGVALMDDDLWHAFATFSGQPPIVMGQGYEDRQQAIALARLAAKSWERALTEEGVAWLRTKDPDTGRGSTVKPISASRRLCGRRSTPPTKH